MTIDYKAQYLHPKWQKKRLEILSRDNFTCQLCGSKDKTLQVHHFYYIHGRKVWEYDSSNFITFCDQCHKHEEDSLKKCTSVLIQTFKLIGFASGDFENLNNIIEERKLSGQQVLDALRNTPVTKSKKKVLTIDDLNAALGENG